VRPERGDRTTGADSAGVAKATSAAWWRRAWNGLHSRFARQIAVAAVVLGGLAATGHFVGGMIGWWHAYEITFGGHKSAPAPTAVRAPGARADAQSLVLLPLVDESEIRDGEWFVDVLTSDLTAEIGRLPGALVISRDTARTYKGKAADPRDVAKDLGVRYVVRGSARRSGDRVRLDLEMVDGDSGMQAWSQRFDLERNRLDDGLGDVALPLARSLNLQTYRSSGKKAAALAPHELQADDLAMQGWAVFLRGLTPENVRESLRLFEEAVGRDPRSTRAWGGVAVASGSGAMFGWLPDRDAASRRQQQAAEQLRQLDENGFFSRMASAGVATRKRDWETALSNADAILEQFPSHAPSHALRAGLLMNLGRFDECLEPLKQALRISPRDPQAGFWNALIAQCHFLRAEYPQAAEFARIATQATPELPMPPLTNAAALHRNGKVDEARKVVAEYRSRTPNFEASHVQRFWTSAEPRFAEGRQRLIDSLRELGMP